MRAAKFARDSWPEQKPGEVVTAFDQRGQHVAGPQVNISTPRSWEELDCPDEITLELADVTPVALYLVTRAMKAAGLSVDHVFFTPLPGIFVYLTKQAEDCWYAGVPRGRRLVLRRI